MSEVNTANDKEWKELQKDALTECFLGNHQYAISNKCVICGKPKK